MNSYDKVTCFLAFCVTLTIITIIGSITYYNLFVTRKAMENGYTQQVLPNGYVHWVKPDGTVFK